MLLDKIVTRSFYIGMAFSLFGAWSKIMHLAGADTWLTIAILTAIVFVIAAIIEVRTSDRIDFREKTMWTIGFIFMSGITGIIYMIMGRKRVNANSPDVWSARDNTGGRKL